MNKLHSFEDLQNLIERQTIKDTVYNGVVFENGMELRLRTQINAYNGEIPLQVYLSFEYKAKRVFTWHAESVENNQDLARYLLGLKASFETQSRGQDYATEKQGRELWESML